VRWVLTVAAEFGYKSPRASTVAWAGCSRRTAFDTLVSPQPEELTMKWLPLTAGLALLATACAPQSDDRSMAQSGAQSGQINCATAEADIRVLESEKTHAMNQLEGGGTTIVPSGLVTEPEFQSGDIQDGGVDATQYHEYLDDRIQQIRTTCGL
jgi:hypothetical protein